MKRTKLITALCVLAVVFLLGIFALPTKAEAATYNGFTYKVSGGKATITDYTGSATNLTIPTTLGGYPVTTIGDWTFADCTRLTSVTIPNSVTSIGSHAFNYCRALTSVTIVDSVTSIGDSAFAFCEALTSVTIPDSVTSIGDSAFHCCKALTGIWVDEDNATFSNDSYGVLFNKDKTTLIQAPVGISGGYTIPNSVTSIGDDAFCWCSRLTSVTIGNSITSIGNSAFYFCEALTSVTIPDSVKSIGDYAFSDCEALTSVTIGDSITSIGYSAFYYCGSLTDVYYAGTEAQWKKITIDSYNSSLTSATIHYQHIHDYTLFPGVTVEPTCTQPGYIEYTCVWGETYRQVLPAGHNYTVFINTVAPTCTEGGHSVYKCSRCDETQTRDVVSAFGHDATVLVNTVEPTCTEGGYSVYLCSRCNKTEKRDPVSALGHDYSGAVTVVEPTCKDKGYTETQCIRCDSIEKTNYKDTVGHKLVILPAVAPTCEKTGLTMGTTCQWCDSVGVAQKEVAALGGKCDYTADPTTCGTCGYVRADVSINQVVLRPACAGLYFKGAFTFGAHETVTRYGIAVSLYNKLPVADDSDATSRYTAGQNSVLISDILGQGKTGRDLIYARPYALLADGTYLYGDVVCTNLKSVVEAIDTQFDGLTTAQQQAIADMYRQNTAAMQSWLIPKIKEYA